MPKNKKRLYICSFGMKPSDISEEAVHALKQADLIISDMNNAKSLFDKLSKKMVCASFFEKNGSFDKSALEKMIAKAFLKFESVVFLTKGNPLFLNLTCYELFEKFSKKVQVKTLPAISSLDWVFDFLVKKFKIRDFEFICFTNPTEVSSFCRDFNLIIMNPHSIRKNKEDLKKFTASLDENYPKSYSFYALSFKGLSEERADLKKISLSELKLFLDEADNCTTLFFPALKK